MLWFPFCCHDRITLIGHTEEGGRVAQFQVHREAEQHRLVLERSTCVLACLLVLSWISPVLHTVQDPCLGHVPPTVHISELRHTHRPSHIHNPRLSAQVRLGCVR